ncbi:3-keto-5-aminohexanoate cleavage protein [Stappia sp. F7233]|uniref:3-keto-5-aminohexanoate cleavage protein n=1 Tax=Stappia albiluteola TaxID=2758565 RepID=A0A839A9D0_9HYPH|nr:3-keto-5-aminohexanoate cleavage protein [Stappia albiluteola]MBA5776143.1 3-keto-5-aminohexanoate cleavage protein [Stappia albiluteola]
MVRTQKKPPMILMSAPNGARKTSADHPELPVTTDEIARTAALVRDAGAAMMHVHIRDREGHHLLDAATYRDVIAAIRREVGDTLVVQITTEAVGRYAPSEQVAVVRETRPEAVSLAIRELIADEASEAPAAEFLAWMKAEAIAPQFILYDGADVARFNDLRRRGIIPFERTFLLFVLGRYATAESASAGDLIEFLKALEGDDPWSVCAFQDLEHKATVLAAILGGHARVGFENNLLMPDGSVAADNAALVKVAAETAARFDREIGTADDARAVLGMT